MCVRVHVRVQEREKKSNMWLIIGSRCIKILTKMSTERERGSVDSLKDRAEGGQRR